MTTYLNASEQGLVKRYREAMLQYGSTVRFGREWRRPGQIKGVPLHVNTRKHPCPKLARGGKSKRLYRKPDQHTLADSINHVTDGNALFHVSRHDRHVSLYGLDIDSPPVAELGPEVDAHVLWQTAIRFGRRLLNSLFPGVESFGEPSRSFPRKGGAYVWFCVDWAGMPQRRRKRYERALGRRLKEVAHSLECPAGLTFDDMKGRGTYTYANPAYDQEWAETLSGIQGKVKEVAVCSEEMSRILTAGLRPDASSFDAMRATLIAVRVLDEEVVDGQTWHWISVSDVAEVTELVGMPLVEMKKRDGYKELTCVECYQKAKCFYGISQDGQRCDRRERFTAIPALEPTLRNHGVLITAPCYHALSRERDNNIEAFLVWNELPRRVVSCSDLRGVLSDDEVEAIERNRRERGSRRFLKSKAANTTALRALRDSANPPHAGREPTEAEHQLMGRVDALVPYCGQQLRDLGLSSQNRYAQAAVAALHLVCSECSGELDKVQDIDRVIEVSLHLVQHPDGPADDDFPDDGPTPAECNARRRRLRAILMSGLLEDFDPSKSPVSQTRSVPPRWLTAADVDWVEAQLADLVSDDDIEQRRLAEPKTPRRRTTRRQMAVVLTSMMWQITSAIKTRKFTTGLTEVTVKRLQKDCKKHGGDPHSAVRVRIIEHLQDLKCVVLVADSVYVRSGHANNRCARYRIGANAPVPAILQSFMNPQAYEPLARPDPPDAPPRAQGATDVEPLY